MRDQRQAISNKDPALYRHMQKNRASFDLKPIYAIYNRCVWGMLFVSFYACFTSNKQRR